MKNAIPLIMIAIVAALLLSFYGGLKYADSKNATNATVSGGQNLRNLTPEERAQRMQTMGSGNGRVRFGGGAGGATNGEIISKDDKSLSLKLTDGGSKIIFFSTSTEIMKSTPGAVDDLKNGTKIFVSGEANQDGSVTAKTIQMR